MIISSWSRFRSHNEKYIKRKKVNVIENLSKSIYNGNKLGKKIAVLFIV